MISYLTEFVYSCSSVGIVPDEKHIIAYLRKVNRIDLKDDFIRFCFYCWENKEEMIEKMLDESDLQFTD